MADYFMDGRLAALSVIWCCWCTIASDYRLLTFKIDHCLQKQTSISRHSFNNPSTNILPTAPKRRTDVQRIHQQMSNQDSIISYI